MANILNLITIGEKKYLVVDSDPSAGAGTSAEVGSLAVWEDGSNVGKAYLKIGASDTAWDKISTATDGSVAVGDYLKLPIYNTNASGQTLDDSAGNVSVAIATDSRASPQEYSIPFVGGLDAEFVLSEGAQSINGVKTFNDAPLLKDGIDLEDPGAGSNKASIIGDAYAADREYMVPDVGADADFVMTEGDQTIAGNKTFSDDVVVNGDLTVNGSLTYLNSTNTDITDKLITLNKGGAAASAGGSGIEFEENAIITGYIKIAADRDGFELKAPNVAYKNDLDLSNLSADRVQKFADTDGTFVMRQDGNIGVAKQVAFFDDANNINNSADFIFDNSVANYSIIELGASKAFGQIKLGEPSTGQGIIQADAQIDMASANSYIQVVGSSDDVNLYADNNLNLEAAGAVYVFGSGIGTGVAHVDGSGQLSTAAVDLTSEVSGILPIANGGTNSSAALNNDRIMISSAGAIVEHSAMTTGSVFFANANGLPGQDNANFFWDDTNDRLGIGLNSNIQARLHIQGSAAANVGQWIEHAGNNTNSAFLTLRKQRAGGAVVSDDTLGAITFAGRDDVSYAASPDAQIHAYALENFANIGDHHGTGLQFEVKGNGQANRNAVLNLQYDATNIANIMAIGPSSAASSVTAIIKSTDIAAGNTDVASGLVSIRSGRSTGTGAGGNIRFQISNAAGASASTQNSSVTRMMISGGASAKVAFYSPDGTKNIGLKVANAATSHDYTLPSAQGAANTVMHNDGSGNLSWSAVSLTADVSGVLPVANGGTNSSAALNNNRIMISSAGAIVEHSALVQGGVYFGNANGLPAQDAANLFWDDSNDRLGLATNAPDRLLDVNGSSIFRSALRIADAVATKANFEVFQDEVSTTNATVTEIASVAIPTDKAVLVEARIVGRRTGGSAGSAGDAAVYVRSARFKNVSGTVTINNLQSDYTSEDVPQWNGTMVVSGTDASIQVNGAANTNIDWSVTYFVIEL